MRLGIPVVLAVLLAAGCVPAKTPGEACRRQAAIAKMNRGIANKPDATADALEDARCDAVEERDHQHDREQAADSERFASAKRAADRELAEDREAERRRIFTVRHAPSGPELGATLPEIRAVCTNQGAALSTVGADGKVFCSIGGGTIFGCALDGRGAAKLCDRYFEGAELVPSRDAVVTKLGPWTRQETGPDGRYFVWESAGLRLVVALHPIGVRITAFVVEPQ